MATKTRGKWLVPRLSDGSIPNWVPAAAAYAAGMPTVWSEAMPTVWSEAMPIVWSEPEPFHAVLQLVEAAAGGFVWKDVMSGATYTMTEREFNRLIREAEWAGPLLVDGLWRPVKRGQNYNVEHVICTNGED